MDHDSNILSRKIVVIADTLAPESLDS